MELTPALYSRLVDLEVCDHLMWDPGSRIEICPHDEEYPRDLCATGLVKIDGAVVPYFVDFAELPEGVREPSEMREIREPLSLCRLQQYLDLKAQNEVYVFPCEVDSLLFVVRADSSELEIADDVLELARRHGLHIRRLHLHDYGDRLSLIDLGGESWGNGAEHPVLV